MLLAQKRQRQAVAGKIGHDDYQYKLNGDPSNHRDHINVRGQGDLDPRRFGGVSRPPFAVDGEDGSGRRGGNNNNNNNGGSGDGGGAGGLLLSDGRGGGAGGAGGLGALGLGAGLFSKAVAPLPDPGELPGPLPAVYRPKPPPLLHAKNPSSLLIPHYVATPMPSTGAGGAGLLTVPAGGAGAAAPLLSGGGGGGGDGLLSARPHTSPSLSPLRLVDQPGAVIHAPAALRPGSGSFLYDDGASEREERVKLKMENRRRAQEYQQVNAWQMEDQRRRRQEDHQRDLMQEREQEGRLVKEREQVRQRELLDIAREQYDRDVKMLGNKAVKPQILIEHELRSGLSPTPSPTSAAAAGTGGLGSSTPRKRHVIVLDGDEEWDENTQRSASATRAAPLATPVTPIPAKISHPWLSQPLPLTPVPDPRAAAQPQSSSAAPSAAIPAPPLFRGAVPLAPITPLERPSRPTTNGLGLGLPPPSTFLSSVEPVEFHFPSNQGLGLGLHNTNSNSNSNHGSTAASMMAGFSYENDSIRRDVQNLASAQRRLEQTVASGRFQLNPLTGSGRGGATYLSSPHPLNQLPIYTPPNRSPPPPAPNLFPGDAGAAGVGGGSRSPPSLFTTDYTSSHVEQHHHHHGAPRSGTPETPSQHGGTVPWNADAIIQLSPIRGGGGGPGSPFGSKAPTSGHDWCPSPSAADRSSASPLPPPSEDLAVACVVLRSPAETPTGQQHQHHQLPLPPVIHISNGSTPTFTSIPPGTVIPDPDAEAVAPSPKQQASTESSAPSSSTHNVGVSHNSDLEVEPGKFVGAPGQLKFSGSLNAKYGHTTTMTTTTTTHATTTTTAPPPAPPASSSVSGVVAASLNTPVRQDRTGRNAEGSSPTTHSPVHEPNSTSLKESVD